jgi:hypothetical protein
MKFIDSDKEHVQVLYELGILDDDDNWELFQKMQGEVIANDPDIETWFRYMKRPSPCFIGE